MTARRTTCVKLCPRLSQIESLEIRYGVDRSGLETVAWNYRWISRSLHISRNVVSLSLHMRPHSVIFLHFETGFYETVWEKPGAEQVSLNRFQTGFKKFWNQFKCTCECAKPVSCGHVKGPIITHNIHTYGPTPHITIKQCQVAM